MLVRASLAKGQWTLLVKVCYFSEMVICWIFSAR